MKQVESFRNERVLVRRENRLCQACLDQSVVSLPRMALMLAVGCLMLLSGSLRAEWKNESFDLVPGWNAIYLHVDPSYATIDVLLQRTPVSEVWLWAPSTSSAQFVTDVQSDTNFSSNWISWVASDPTNSSLQNFIGNAAYLVYVEEEYNDGMTDVAVSEGNPFELQLIGKAVPPTYTWTASGQNFIGFSTRDGSEPSFSNFFGLSDTLNTSTTKVYEYLGGELDLSNPALVDSPNNTQVVRGRAYWVRDSEYNRYFGAFSVNLQDADGVHFGTGVTAYRIRLTNTSSQSHTVSLMMMASLPPADGTSLVNALPPFLVRGDLDPETLTYPFADLRDTTMSWNLAAAGEVGSSVEVVLGIDRADMATTPGDIYGAILRFTDNLAGTGYTQIDVPATAVTGSMAGLWVGQAEISQVQQDLASFAVDDDGATALNDDGSAVVSSLETGFGDVPRAMPLRLIVHMAGDEAGTTQLLQRVYYGLDENSSPILASLQGVLNPDHLDVARRITSIHLPWSANNTSWAFDDSLDFISSLSTTVTTSFNDHAANPFLHTYHPDHDNRSPLFEAYGTDERGFESFDIVREISLNFGTSLIPFESTTTSTSAEVTGNEVPIVPALPDGILMLDVPGGSFVMGNDAAVGPLAADHKPERVVNMSAFEMSEAEISVEQYVTFLNAAYADGLITVADAVDGTFVYGASGQPYAGHKFLELSGSRVLKDHDGDGDIDPENPLNQCWIEYDGAGTFSVKDPASVDWEGMEFSSDADLLTPSEWGDIDPDPVVVSPPTQFGRTPNNPSTNLAGNLDGARLSAAADGFAYVVSNPGDRLHVFDVSTPTSPVLVQVVTSIGNVSNVMVHDGYVYVCDRDAGIHIFAVADLTTTLNVSRSASSVRVGLIGSAIAPNMNDAMGQDIEGDYLYAINRNDHLLAFDISNLPTLPTEAAADVQLTDGNTTFTDLRWVEVENGVAYVVARGQDSVLLYDVATSPTDLTNLLHVINDGDESDALGGPLQLSLSNGILYVVANSDNALPFFDVTFDPGAGPVTDNAVPVEVGKLQNAVNNVSLLGPRHCFALGNILYVVAASSTDSLHVFDMDDPSIPNLIYTAKHATNNVTNLNDPWSVVADQSAIYVASTSSDSFSIFPQVLGTSLLAGSPKSELVNGGMDAGDDESFVFQEPVHVVTSHHVAYVADRSADRISILDVSDPSSVEILGFIVDGANGNKLDNVSHLTLAGDLLVATANQDGEADTISIYDVSDPENPVRLSIITDNVQSNNLNAPLTTAVWGCYLFITNIGGSDSDAITIFNILDPSSPVLVDEVVSGSVDSLGNSLSLGNVKSLVIVNGVAYAAATEQSRIAILDVSDPSDVTLLGEIIDGSGFNHLGSLRHLFVEHGVLYCSSGGTENAVTIMDVVDPGAPQLLAELVHGTGDYSDLEAPERFAVQNGVLYVPSQTSGSVTVVDVSDPANPALLETVSDGQDGYGKLSGAYAAAVDGNLLMVASVTDSALTLTEVDIQVGETIASWPELTRGLPVQSEVSTWPATFVKWHGAKAFAEYYGCDLPTEAQWEYAAKGGSDLDFATSDGKVDASRANYNEYNVHPDSGHVEPIKSYQPNPWGFYDMSGNVWEWCRDWYDANLYANRPDPDYDPVNEDYVLGTTEPIENASFVGGPGQEYNGDTRVKRGGSWNFHETSLGTAERERDYTWRGNDHFGFRVARQAYSITVLDEVDFSALTSSSTTLTGTYQEKITLRGKGDEAKEYNIAGEFKLIRISDIDTLRTE